MNDRGFYEQFWQQHSENLSMQMAIHVESRRPLLKMLESYLPEESESRFLEVGCGTALDSCLLLKRRPQAKAIVIDLSLQAVLLASRNADQLRLPLCSAVADLNSLPFPTSNFDLVFSQGVLEHFEEPWTALEEQVRVLRPGGVLVVDVPQKFNVYTLRKHRAMKANRWPWGWEKEYSVGEVQGWAKRYGLQVLGAIGHQHGRLLDRLVVHPHRMLHNKLLRRNGTRNGNGHYVPGKIAQAWEGLWDRIDSQAGPYLAINVAVAYRKGTKH